MTVYHHQRMSRPARPGSWASQTMTTKAVLVAGVVASLLFLLAMIGGVVRFALGVLS